MRKASVPVVGYLSFLASSSAMQNDFIALHDHLLPKMPNQKTKLKLFNQSKQNPETKTKIPTKKRTHLGIFSTEEPVSGFLQSSKSEVSETIPCLI